MRLTYTLFVVSLHKIVTHDDVSVIYMFYLSQVAYGCHVVKYFYVTEFVFNNHNLIKTLYVIAHISSVIQTAATENKQGTFNYQRTSSLTSV